jgi:serine/threonine protein kinase
MLESSSETITLVGRVLGDFRIEGVLGQGADGVVVRARHRTFGRAVAIKVIDPASGRRATLTAALAYEAHLATRVVHENVARVERFAWDAELGPYMIMELVEGWSLETLAHFERRLSGRGALLVASQIAAGLEAVHQAGLVHGDVKPGNIVLGQRDHRPFAKLVDFGRAVDVREDEDAHRQSGSSLGTPRYMSPEQWRGDRLDARSDVYSFGVTLFRIASGEAMSQALTEIIERCVEARPDDRFASMRDVLRALAAA